MSRLELAALELQRILWNNIGINHDWPIRVECDDDDLEDRLILALNELRDASEEVEPGIGRWPIEAA